MASSDSSTKKVTLKLFFEKTSEKVLFAEAGKEFIDFLCHLLVLPVGTVIRPSKDIGIMGSLGALYFENLSDTYMQSSCNKSMILEPKSPSSGLVSPLLLLKDNSSSAPKTYYSCSNRVPSPFGSASCHMYVSDQSNASCPSCGKLMNSPLKFVEPPKSVASHKTTTEEGGYVKGVVTYMVMDDLVVQPMSTISCLTLIKSFHVKDVGALEIKVIELGMDEGIELLKASLQSKTVLTDVFLRKK